MVYEKYFINIQSNIMIRINSNLNCKNFGIYAAKCSKYGENYVGQTQNILT